MGKIVVTIKILPNDTSLNMDKTAEKVKEIIKSYKGEAGKYQIEPIAFGLKELYIYFLIDETGDTESIIKEISNIDGIDSAEVIDIRKEVDVSKQKF